MAKTISNYYAMWRLACSLSERYAAELGKEHLADEQFVIQQHAVTMMSKTQAANEEEIRMKLRVAAYESGVRLSDADDESLDTQLKLAILKDLDALVTGLQPDS